jgi:hypothetical protein
MSNIDPLTGLEYPADAIQRVLFIAGKVHVYQIPPMSSNKGHTASTWTVDGNKRQMATCRLRIIETALPSDDGQETVETNILLENPSSGELFVAAPYTSPSVVEQVLDSSRFFAIRVEGGGGRKALLGIGFEERSEAFDFSTELQNARKVQGFDKVTPSGPGRKGSKGVEAPAARKDFSLKEGETITINIGGKGRRNRDGRESTASSASTPFALPAPPQTSKGGVSMPFIPPPPSAQDVKAERRRSRQNIPLEPHSAADMGFDDGEFGEFQ